MVQLEGSPKFLVIHNSVTTDCLTQFSHFWHFAYFVVGDIGLMHSISHHRHHHTALLTSKFWKPKYGRIMDALKSICIFSTSMRQNSTHIFILRLQSMGGRQCQKSDLDWLKNNQNVLRQTWYFQNFYKPKVFWANNFTHKME